MSRGQDLGRRPVSPRMPLRVLAALTVVSLAAPAAGAPKRQHDVPCKGCLFEAPASPGKSAPLLVLLHGDAPGTVPDVGALADVFSAEAAARGVALFAPRCPVAEGCAKGSWWQWEAGDPRVWLEAQLRAIEATVAIDPDRVWIAGWSGGASYLGWWSAALDGRFAAVAHLGGGMRPSTKGCARCELPTLFVVGDANPLHHLAVGLRDHYLACKAEVRWDLHPKTDHGGEWAVVRAKTTPGMVLDWFSAHPRRCPVPAAAILPAASVPVVAGVASASAPSLPTAPPGGAPSSAMTRCGCTTPGRAVSSSHSAWILVGAGLLSRRRGGTLRRRASPPQPQLRARRLPG